MSDYRLDHLGDAPLLAALSALVARDRRNTALLLAHLAEVDARKLYLPAAYSSMFAYCVGELRFSEGGAAKRIHAARAARAHPRLFEDVACGRLHLTAVCLLAPHLTSGNVDEFVAAATHRKKVEIEEWLAGRGLGSAKGPLELTRGRITPIAIQAPEPPSEDPDGSLFASPAEVGAFDESPCADSQVPVALPADEHTLAYVAPAPPSPPVPVPPPQPPAAPHQLLRVALSPEIHAKLLRAQALLAHAIPDGDLGQLIDRALEALILKLERRKFGRVERHHEGARGERGDTVHE